MKYFLDEIGTKYIAQKIQDVVRVMPCDGLDEVSDGQVACVPVTGYQDEYLTLSALEDGTITITIPAAVNSTYATSLSYSKDKSSWVETVVDDTDQTITIPVSGGEDVYLKGKAKQWSTNTTPGYSMNINSSANIIASGNTMSLLYEDDFKDKTVFLRGAVYIFRELFKNNTHLINAENLIFPAIKLIMGCYQNVFKDCTSLTTAPELPATTLESRCYYGMFSGCSSLTAAPALPATELNESCCDTMFKDCTSLTTAPALPATTLAPDCYSYMFYGCTSLTTAPVLPATTLTNYCYQNMFYGCAALTTAPELPATTLAQYCYSNVFYGCTSLKAAPALPATTLANYCYRNMFQSCTSLETGPTTLPATTLVQSCYAGMFAECPSLTTAPTLPATTLAPQCYQNMLYGCKALTTAPELPATTLAERCYYQMFYICSKLNNITMLATDILATDCMKNWVSGVASTGTFIKSPSMTTLPDGASGIPSGWTVFDDSDYLTLSALGDGEIKITIPAGINSTYATSLSYSKDKSSWIDTIIDDTEQTISIPVTSGEDVYLKGKAKQWSTNIWAPNTFSSNISSDCNINASGNTMSLLYGDSFKDKTAFPVGSECMFTRLFKDNSHLINAENLILPATTLALQCYDEMFEGCTSLTTAPKLSATKLAPNCYQAMFQDCTALTAAPALPATTLTSACYLRMFYGCSSLTTAPELPATVSTDHCYQQMFQNCTSLKTAPALPATVLEPYCYFHMFEGCTALETAPELPATELADYCYDAMFSDCKALTTAPELPATVLTEACYYGMFGSCSSLNNITMLATDISASRCLNAWVGGVSSTGTFTKAASMTSLPVGTDGIPSGWTVIDYSA